MIIGKGLIARTLQPADLNGIIVFASGVSDSVNAQREDYLRESDLLIQTLKKPGKLYYFSTISLFDPELNEAMYIRHKKNMEATIRSKSDNYCIIRLPNIASLHGNPNNMIPYFYHAINSRLPVKIKKHARRFLIDANMLLGCFMKFRNTHAEQTTLNLLPPDSFSVPDIYLTMAQILKAEALYETIDGGSEYESEIGNDIYKGPGSELLRLDLRTLLTRVLNLQK